MKKRPLRKKRDPITNRIIKAVDKAKQKFPEILKREEPRIRQMHTLQPEDNKRFTI